MVDILTKKSKDSSCVCVITCYLNEVIQFGFVSYIMIVEECHFSQYFINQIWYLIMRNDVRDRGNEHSLSDGYKSSTPIKLYIFSR